VARLDPLFNRRFEALGELLGRLVTLGLTGVLLLIVRSQPEIQGV